MYISRLYQSIAILVCNNEKFVEDRVLSVNNTVIVAVIGTER
jgi:hypothetical protein